jgi:3-oxoacyl-[acyl-carrier-protein] synthase III
MASNNPGDVLVYRIRLINKAGVRECVEMAKGQGRRHTELDLKVIRAAAKYGYEEAAARCNVSKSTVFRTVKAYGEYAVAILEKGKGS